MSQTLTVRFNWPPSRTRSHARAKNSTPSQIPQSAAAKSRRKLKETNPDRYKEYLARDAERKRKHYASTSNEMTDNTLKERRGKWAAGKREQRKKNKEEHIKTQSTNNSKKRYKDIMTPQEKKKYMADKKRESRGKLTSQKKVIINQKEVKRRRISRKRDIPDIEEDQSQPTDIMRTPSKTAVLKSPTSRSTIHRKIATIKEKLPSSPRTFATVVSKLVEKASPSKKAELEKRGVVCKLQDSLTMSSLKTTIKEIKANVTEKKRKQYNLLAYACLCVSQYGMASRIASSLGIGTKLQKKMKQVKEHKEMLVTQSRKKRKDAIDAETGQKVKEHWMSEGISRIVPHKKCVKKGQPLNVLECSYIQAYRAFKAANPNIKIGYVTFIKLNPSYVRHLKALERSVCCCIKCENIKLKLKMLNRQAKSNTDTGNLYIDDIHMLSKKTLCPYNDPDFPEKQCVDRACPNCNAAQLFNWYSPMLAAEGDSQITYDQWKVVEETKPMKVKGQKETVKKKFRALRLVTSSISCRQLVANLVKDAEPFPAHLFRARWQADQFRQSKINIPHTSAVLVADFAENYACSMQDEVQSYHWGQAQVTIHPVMAYINNADQTSDEPTHTDSIFCITDDPKHDAAAVHRFLQVTNNYLKEKYNITSSR